MKISWGRDWPVIALALATGVLIAPLWSVHSPAMPDYPAHLAGFYLIGGGAQTEPSSAFYDIRWVLVPNLASELIVPLFAKLVPLEIAIKLFLSMAVAMWIVGPALIHRAVFGRIGLAPLAGAFFAYNANFTWGFFNYYFATGFCFLVFAAWIASHKKRGILEIFGFTLAVCALYVFHLVAVALLLLMILCFEFTRVANERAFSVKTLLSRALPIAVVFLPVAIAFLFFKPTGADGGHLAFNIIDTLDDRFGAAIQSYFDEPAYFLTGGLTIAWVLGVLFGRVRVHPSMTALMITLAVLSLVVPEWALGGWGVDLRLPAVLGAMMFASVELRMDRNARLVAAGILLLTLCWSAAILTENWRGYDRQFGEFRAAIRDLPKGAKLVTVLDGDALGKNSDPPYWHMAEFAIVDRGAFTPLMFTTKGQHVVQLKHPFEQFAAGSAQQGSPPDISELEDLAIGRTDNDPDIDDTFPYLKFFQCHFDEAVVIHGTGKPTIVPGFLTLRHAGTFFSLYDIHPTRGCRRQ